MKFWLFLCLPFLSFSQVIPAGILPKIQEARKKQDPLLIASHFYGLPYVSHALSNQNPEKFVVDFTGFDCVTLVENVWSLYRSNGVDSLFLKELAQIRYSQKPISFENRNHYLSAALAQMEEKGLFKQVIPAHFRVLAVKKIDFLSHYLAPKNLLISLPSIQATEQSLLPLNYVPSAAFPQIKSYLHSGDLIAFVSKRKDLDYQHVGFIREMNGHFYLVHASQDRQKVCQSVESISVYLKNHPSMIGFNVFRPEYAK
ncbi:N-acetylmuramoyl-L-alanine amidase-like domain-containing protein [Aquirufa sp. HETE-83D]|uniref:N-acetylmuramoyl-L-alanine amidase-like domain-containing protein n=1 Tax=Aquirufa esocilacus TaxID=3096513 RepID=A0ABW6DG89_9BACT